MLQSHRTSLQESGCYFCFSWNGDNIQNLSAVYGTKLRTCCILRRSCQHGSQLTVSYEAEKGQELELLVINLAGQKIMSSFVSIDKGNNTMTLDMENVPAGIYFVQMISNAGKITRKLIKD